MGKMSDVKIPDGAAEEKGLVDKGLNDFKKGLEQRGKSASEGFAYKFKDFLGRGNTSACPAPITFEVFKVRGSFKYDWLCKAMEMTRGLVIAIFAFFTAKFVIKNLK